MLEILVPTYNKTKEDLIKLYDFLKIDSDVLFAVQNKKNNSYSFKHKKHNIRVIETDEIGVSKNRNTLKNNAIGDICFCIDDDCVLKENYEKIIIDFFKEHECDYALFNGIVTHEGGRKIHDKPTCKVRRFSQVGYAGGPGLAFTKEANKKHDLKYNETLGYPNKITLGEDTTFVHDIVKSKAIFYRSQDVLFDIALDKDNSTYFVGYDENFFISRGYVFSLIHPCTKRLYAFRGALKFKSKANLSVKNIYKMTVKGFKYKNE